MVGEVWGVRKVNLNLEEGFIIVKMNFCFFKVIGIDWGEFSSRVGGGIIDGGVSNLYV